MQWNSNPDCHVGCVYWTGGCRGRMDAGFKQWWMSTAHSVLNGKLPCPSGHFFWLCESVQIHLIDTDTNAKCKTNRRTSYKTSLMQYSFSLSTVRISFSPFYTELRSISLLFGLTNRCTISCFEFLCAFSLCCAVSSVVKLISVSELSYFSM